MIKTLIGIGDIHLRNKNFYRVGFKAFLDWFDKKFPDEARDSTEILLAGDVLNKVSMLPLVAASTVELFEVFHKKAKTVYVILGNHDYGLSKYKVISTKDFLEKEGAVVIEDFCEYKTKLGFNVLCLPWKYGASHAKVNAFIDSCDLSKEYDACTAHWELESLYGSDFVDLSKVKAKTFMCGHIHSHKVNPKYLGSILPNSIAETKDSDKSIIRALSMSETGDKWKEHELEIPNFLQLKTTTIQNLTDISHLSKEENCFYKILHPKTIATKDITAQAKLSEVNVYGTSVLEEEKAEINLKADLESIKEYTTQSHLDIINLYKDSLQIDNNLLGLCLQAIQEVA